VTADDQDLGDVIAREQELLRSECRADAGCLRELLHPDFLEHGASGTVWTRDQILERLPTAPDLDAPATGMQAQRIAADVALVTFTLGGARPSLRSSVWVRDSGGRWRMRFHQGTFVPER
jgi:ribonuclease HI